MRIWILTTNDDDGTWAAPHTDKSQAHHEAFSWCEERWPSWYPNDRMPLDWQTAYGKMLDCPGFMDSIIVKEFDLPEAEPNELDRSYILKAIEGYASDDIEIDDQAPVSIGEDGAFVQAWVWVPDTGISADGLLEKHGYRITSAQTFVEKAPLQIIQAVVAGVGKLDNMVLWSDDPKGFHLTMPTFDELLEEFNEHMGGR